MIDKPMGDSLPPEISLHREISHQIGREETTIEMTKIGDHPAGTLEYTQGKKPETTQEERGGMRKETVTLAMEGDAEGAARRP